MPEWKSPNWKSVVRSRLASQQPYAGLRLLFGTLPSATNFVALRFDVLVFVFALLVSLVTSLLFGTIPALQASRVGLAETLKQEVRTMGRLHRFPEPGCLFSGASEGCAAGGLMTHDVLVPVITFRICPST